MATIGHYQEHSILALGLQLNVLSASSQSDFDNAFVMLIRQRTDALIVSADPFSSAIAINSSR